MAKGLMAGLALVLTVALSAGCTMLRLGYGHLDTLAAITADDYFDLDAQQKQEFNARFDRLHEWHRRVQLPEYAAFLTDARTRVQNGLTRADVVWFMDGLDERYRTIVKRGADDAVALLATIAPAQLDALQRRWEKDNRKFIREHRVDDAPGEQRQERAKRMLNQISDWTGSLNDEQEERITAMIDKMPLAERARHEDRLRRQREFLKVMELRANREAFAARLRHWLLNWEEGRSPELARAVAEWRERRVEIYVAVVRTLTPGQREHLAHRLQSHIGDFTQLAGR